MKRSEDNTLSKALRWLRWCPRFHKKTLCEFFILGRLTENLSHSRVYWAGLGSSRGRGSLDTRLMTSTSYGDVQCDLLERGMGCRRIFLTGGVMVAEMKVSKDITPSSLSLCLRDFFGQMLAIWSRHEQEWKSWDTAQNMQQHLRITRRHCKIWSDTYWKQVSRICVPACYASGAWR